MKKSTGHVAEIAGEACGKKSSRYVPPCPLPQEGRMRLIVRVGKGELLRFLEGEGRDSNKRQEEEHSPLCFRIPLGGPKPLPSLWTNNQCATNHVTPGALCDITTLTQTHVHKPVQQRHSRVSGRAWLPVDDDRVRGRLVSVSAALLIAAATVEEKNEQQSVSAYQTDVN